MGTGNVFRMHPQVSGVSHTQGQFVILQIALAYEDFIAIGRNITHGFGFLGFLLSFFLHLSADEAAFCQFGADFRKVCVVLGIFQSIQYTFQINQFFFVLLFLNFQRSKGTFCLVVFCKIFLGIFRRGFCRINGNFDFRHIFFVIIDGFEGGHALRDSVDIGCQQFAFFLPQIHAFCFSAGF